MLRRFAAVTLPLLAVLGTAAPAQAVPSGGGDHLTLTVTDSGSPGTDGTYELYCHPTGGTHPDASRACDRLDEVTVWGRDPFAPVPPDAICTDQYGGPARARVTGVWAGRPVDASYRRTDGCEISRWDAMRPFLPVTSSGMPLVYRDALPV
ncbi:SSI family serine proteinase inhibitor [Streptomyces sp. NPDC054863]